ncbi:MAG: hypothetical protein Q7S44_01040 [bacterium]|nr:hypothetical protein [bacterium]
MLDDNDLKRIGQLISESEGRLRKDLGQEIIDSERRVIKEVGNFVTNNLLPQLNDKAEKHVTDRLDNRLDKMADQVNDYESRLKKLEKRSSASLIPAV